MSITMKVLSGYAKPSKKSFMRQRHQEESAILKCEVEKLSKSTKEHHSWNFEVKCSECKQWFLTTKKFFMNYKYRHLKLFCPICRYKSWKISYSRFKLRYWMTLWQKVKELEELNVEINEKYNKYCDSKGVKRYNIKDISSPNK